MRTQLNHIIVAIVGVTMIVLMLTTQLAEITPSKYTVTSSALGARGFMSLLGFLMFLVGFYVLPLILYDVFTPTRQELHNAMLRRLEG